MDPVTHTLTILRVTTPTGQPGFHMRLTDAEGTLQPPAQVYSVLSELIPHLGSRNYSIEVDPQPMAEPVLPPAPPEPPPAAAKTFTGKLKQAMTRKPKPQVKPKSKPSFLDRRR